LSGSRISTYENAIVVHGAAKVDLSLQIACGRGAEKHLIYSSMAAL